MALALCRMRETHLIVLFRWGYRGESIQMRETSTELSSSPFRILLIDYHLVFISYGPCQLLSTQICYMGYGGYLTTASAVVSSFHSLPGIGIRDPGENMNKNKMIAQLHYFIEIVFTDIIIIDE